MPKTLGTFFQYIDIQHYLSLLGVSYALIGEPEKALLQVEKYASLTSSFINFHPTFYLSDNYLKARIEANLGHKKEAVNLLEKAIELDRMPFSFNRFKEDHFLKPLFGYPPFEELVKPKG